jgi:hypothetical protein
MASRHLTLLLALPLLVAAGPSNKQAVQAVLDKLMVGEALPPAILDRQVGHPDLPDLDQAIARVPGCKVRLLEPLSNGTYAVQWKCKDRKKEDRPAVMMLYVSDGQVTRITTALLLSGSW